MPPKTILLIEPDESESRELAAVLEKSGYQVDTAANSTEGLCAFSDRRHDLVVVEVLLSGMNGLQVCKIAKDQGEQWDVKVIVVSKVYQSRAMEHDALSRYRADAYFSRPFPMYQLLEKIGELLGDPNTGKPLRKRPRRAVRPRPAQPPAAPPPRPRSLSPRPPRRNRP